MALSIINYFFLDIPDARVPFMILDAIVVYGLNVWEKRLKLQKERIVHEEAQQHELEKKSNRAEKAAVRNQQKSQGRKLSNNKGPVSFSPKQSIHQPDNNKKSR